MQTGPINSLVTVKYRLPRYKHYIINANTQNQLFQNWLAEIGFFEWLIINFNDPNNKNEANHALPEKERLVINEKGNCKGWSLSKRNVLVHKTF